MKIEYQDIITLNDKNEYIAASKIEYNNNKYAFLVDINNNANMKFVKIEKDLSLTQLDNINDKELINELIPLFYMKSKKDIRIISE